DACAYEFDSDRITVKPGRSETVPLVIEPVTRPLIGASRLFGFAVTARSTEDSYVSCSAHGQLERRALLSPLVAAVIAVLLLSSMTWAMFRPRPVAIHAFAASPAQIKEGEEVTLTWDATNMADGYIQPDNFRVQSQLGSYKVHPEHTMTYTFMASGGGKHES